MSLDLTPFGFTPTETAVYSALLDLGPSSGYAVAKAVSIARANAYQALSGLAAKGGATVVPGRPQRFRAVRPAALLSAVAALEAAKLERLERELKALGPVGAETLVPIEGRRPLADVAMRTAARAAGEVRCLAPASFLRDLLPAWRKRASGGAVTRLWSVGPAPDLGGAPVIALSRDRTAAHFPSPPVLLWTGEEAVLALMGDEPSGYWMSVQALVGTVAEAIRGTVDTADPGRHIGPGDHPVG